MLEISKREMCIRDRMKEEARIFYKNASPYKPTYYWIDVEEETMSNMEQGVQAFLAELKRLGAENVGLYIGAYFMLEQEVSTKNFDAVWIPAYGTDSGYYEALPNLSLIHISISINRGLLIWQQGLLQDSYTIDRLHLLIHLMRLSLLT